MRPNWLVLALCWACTGPAQKPRHILPESADTGRTEADTGPADTGGPHAPAPGPDTGIGTVTIDRPEAALSADEVAATISAILATGIPDPISARAAYIDALDHRDAFCPGGGDLSIIGEWDGCVASSGWTFAGYTEYTGESEPGLVDDFHLLADFRFKDPEERWFIGGGELDLVLSTDGADLTWTSTVTGTFSYAGAEGWMAVEGASAVLQTVGTWTGHTWALELEGTIANGTEGLYLAGVSASSETCDGQPSGRFGLRDPSGYWYAMDTTCGCGPVQFHDDDPLGDACVDAIFPLDALAMDMRP